MENKLYFRFRYFGGYIADQSNLLYHLWGKINITAHPTRDKSRSIIWLISAPCARPEIYTDIHAYNVLLFSRNKTKIILHIQ